MGRAFRHSVEKSLGLPEPPGGHRLLGTLGVVRHQGKRGASGRDAIARIAMSGEGALAILDRVFESAQPPAGLPEAVKIDSFERTRGVGGSKPFNADVPAALG
ncbi:MAG TPA: hypothetical protein VMQ65_02105 [Candidatus Limnocylindria bacterium]|nr:hypothetical protein [Candidatus Limnocylindria bacterium]